MQKEMGKTADGRRIQVIHDAGPSFGGLFYVYVEEYPGSLYWKKGAPHSVQSAAEAEAHEKVGV